MADAVKPDAELPDFTIPPPVPAAAPMPGVELDTPIVVDDAEFTTPPPAAATPPVVVVEAKPLDGINVDRALVYSILQGGVRTYYKARDKGIRPEHVLDDERRVYALFEEFAKKGRLPTEYEIKIATGVDFKTPSEPFDIDLFSEKVKTRALYNVLKSNLRTIVYDKLVKDPLGTRDALIDLVRKTSFSIGGVSSYNDALTARSVLESYERAKATKGGLLGLSSPWPNVDKYSLGLQNGELTVLLAKRKLGKTLRGETLVHDPITGREQTIETLVKNSSGQVYTWQRQGAITVAQPTAYMDCGEKECLKITWRSGREMIAAPTHPFLTPRGYVPLSDIKAGHHTAAVKKLPEPLKPEPMPEHEIKILAYMIADGGCSKPSTPTYTKYEQTVVDDLSAALAKIACKLTTNSGRRGQFFVTMVKPSSDGRSPIVEMMKAHGLHGEKSIYKVIPEVIFSLPDAQLGLFLGRLWSGDGSIAANQTVSYSTGSQRMALQIQHLLLRFGVESHVRTLTRDTDHEFYYEVVIHRLDIEAFKLHVGRYMLGPKATLANAVEFQGRSRVGWIKNEELHDLVRAEMDARPELLPAVGKELNYRFVFQKGHVFDRKSGRVRQRVFEAFCKVYDSPLQWVLDENIWWDEVESIVPAGKHHCYDLTVEPTACYIANDYVVHNSWMLLAWFLHILKTDLKPGESVFVVSMEMPVELVYRRLAAIDLKLCYEDFRGGRLTIESEKRLNDWVTAAMTPDPSKPNLYVAGPNTIRDVSDIAAKTAELNPRAVGIDGLYILGRDAKLGMWERTLKSVTETKLDLCANLNVPVVATTQLKGSKAKDDLKADADDAAYAKAIGDYADSMRGLHMDDELETAKQRIFTGMESREFRPVDLCINFNLDTMDFSEIKVYTAADREKKDEKEDGGGFTGAGPPPKKGGDDDTGSGIIIAGAAPEPGAKESISF